MGEVLSIHWASVVNYCHDLFFRDHEALAVTGPIKPVLVDFARHRRAATAS